MRLFIVTATNNEVGPDHQHAVFVVAAPSADMALSTCQPVAPQFVTCAFGAPPALSVQDCLAAVVPDTGNTPTILFVAMGK